ncbi:MAG: hypothetical protein GY799_13130 [Desulfobulbaceae bacterium]|nr:hypothetical protein [Desulfobulbaceae bacterium]
MRIFFYSVKKSNCSTGCQWQVCPQRYLAKLRTINGLQSICPIFGEISYASQALAVTPRNGDLIILYAEDIKEIDAMIAARDGFDGLKKILVVADSAGVDGDKYHMLAPRFITQAQRNISELEAVIQKMKGYTH